MGNSGGMELREGEGSGWSGRRRRKRIERPRVRRRVASAGDASSEVGRWRWGRSGSDELAEWSESLWPFFRVQLPGEEVARSGEEGKMMDAKGEAK